MLTSLQALLTDTFSLRRAFVVAGPEYPTDILPIVYGNLAGGKGGVSYCPGVVEASFTYLIADHAILSAASGNSPTFYSDNIVVVPASWTDAATVGGQTAATVTFSSSLAGTRIGFRGKGKVSGGALIENPIAVVEDFLTTIVGVSTADFDATALADAKARAARAGYTCAGVLDQDRSPATTISEILACFGGYYFINPDGKITLVIDDGTVAQMSGLAGHLRAHEFEQAEATWTRTDIINQVGVNYTRNAYDITLQQRFQDADAGTSTADTVSQQTHGAMGPGASETALEFPWCRDGDTVRAVQSVIVKRLATPRARIRMQSPSFRLAHLDVGDHVGFSWPRLYDPQGRPLVNQIGLVEEVAVDADLQKVDLTIRDTGGYLARAYPADGSVKAGGPYASGYSARNTIALAFVSGAQFADISGFDLSPFVGQGYYLIVTDDYGKGLRGRVLSASAGMTHGPNLLTNGGFDSNTVGWTNDGISTTTSVAGGQSGNCCQLSYGGGGANLQWVGQPGKTGHVVGAVYDYLAYIKSGTSGNESMQHHVWLLPDASRVLRVHYTTTGSWAQILMPFTSEHDQTGYYLMKETATAGTMLFDTVEVMRRLTPFATGAWVAWESEDSGFNRNADGVGYSYRIETMQGAYQAGSERDRRDYY